MPSQSPVIELHLYCHGLGDCHLLRVPSSSSADKWILIDCGIHTSMKGGADLVRTVVEDIHAQTGGELDAIVGTHEHWDHISGFHPAQKLFDKFTVNEVWLAWTENPSNDEAQELDTFKGMAVSTLRMAQNAMPKSTEFAKLKLALGGVAGFMGIEGGAAASNSFAMKGERVRDARDGLVALSDPPKYLDPGDVIEVSDAVRCYVLAPPHNSKFNLLDSKALTYNAATGAPLMLGLKNALEINQNLLSPEEDPLSPFDGDEGAAFDSVREKEKFLIEHYASEPWRMIDHDWLMPASELALQLDNRTNNSSLVLAFEMIATGHVLIFAADAQIGNWQSWQAVTFPEKDGRPKVTGRELLERAVFYKVGHHGSRNATMSSGGLELMNKLELAFNPTDRVMAHGVGWGDIPAVKLNEELKRRTADRLIESDRPEEVTAHRFAAGGALAAPVTVRTAKGSEGRKDVKCVVCKIS